MAVHFVRENEEASVGRDAASTPIPWDVLRRASQLHVLRGSEQAFASALSYALRDHPKGSPDDSRIEERIFLGNVFTRLVQVPDDLLRLCELMGNDRLRIALLRSYVRHDLADRDVIFGLVEAPQLFHSLPDDSSWREVVVLLYGANVINTANGRLLTIDEVAPLGVDVEKSVVRFLLGSAYEDGLLHRDDALRLPAIFPGDAHFENLKPLR